MFQYFLCYNTSRLNEDDLAIGISFSGSSKDTNRVLEIAKEAGAKILCITHHDVK